MIQYRRLEDYDSMEELTDLLHRAYAPLAEIGLHFVATHQPVEVTVERCAKGKTFVATLDNRLIGTLTYTSRLSSGGGCQWYERKDVGVFGQFGVLPEFKGTGIGSDLLALAEQEARNEGASELACDTAIPAVHLIHYYTLRGFREVERVQWKEVNYPSVILSKALSPS